jgi:hypothetical protein
MDPETSEVWRKYEAVVRALARGAWAVRMKEKSSPSLANMIINVAKGK